MARKSKVKKNRLIIVASAAAVLIVGVVALEMLGVTDFYKANKAANSNEAKTTSTAPSAQEDFTQGGPRDVRESDDNQGLVEDTGGDAPVTPESQWTSSADQKITAYSPAKNSVIKKGDSISGASSLSKVSFRLIDDVSGVIAEGQLSVVGGKFSGVFDFSTTGTNGRLDLYTANADGVESSTVEIPVRFK